MLHDKPVVSIIGRPNTGKSALFNRIIMKKLAIVHETSGVTRDSKQVLTDWNRCTFYISDTGGLVPESEDIFQELIEEQVYYAMDNSELILFVVDYSTGITDVDEVIAKRIRTDYDTSKVMLVVNKADKTGDRHFVADFYKLGFGDPVPVSALHGVGIGDMLDCVIGRIKEYSVKHSEMHRKDEISVAVVGKPNTGKSSLLNSLLGYSRLIVSEIAGTTRDPIDTFITYNEKNYKFIDTAGIRRHKKIPDKIDYYSVVRTEKVINSSDVVVLMLDASDSLTNNDEAVINLISASGRPVVLLANKWDLVTDKESNTHKSYYESFCLKFPNLAFAPILTISATSGQRVNKIFEQIDYVYSQWNKELDKEEIDLLFNQIVSYYPHIKNQNRDILMKRMFQVGTKPPCFAIIVNWPELVTEEYKRYFGNSLRKKVDFKGTPIKFVFKKKLHDDSEVEKFV